MYCIFCYEEYFDTGESPAELDLRRKSRQKICEAFYKTVHRTMLRGVQPECGLGKDALESCCYNCLHIINNYRKLAFQMQCLQLRLNWQTQQLFNVIKGADSSRANQKRFREKFICPEDIPAIFKFRAELTKKSANELRNREPKVLLDRLNSQLPDKVQASVVGIVDDYDNVGEILSPKLSISVLTSPQVIGDGDSRSEHESIKSLELSSIEYKDEEGDTIHSSDMEDSYSDSLQDPAEDISNIALVEVEAKYEVHDNDEVSEGYPLAPVLESFPHDSTFARERINNCENQSLDLTRRQENMSGKVDFILPNNYLIESDTEHDVIGSALVCHIPGCGKTFENESSYQWHRILHGGRQEMVHCSHPACGKAFLNDNFLHQHIKIHNVMALPSSSSVIQKKWFCEKCNIHYSTKFNLRRHIIKQHQTESSTGNNLTTVSSIRTERKQCNKPHPKPAIRFGSLQRMFKRPYQGFRHNDRWYNPQYRCLQCKKLCRNSFKLREHMRTHSGERPFCCALCSSRFATKSNLKRHAKSIHKLNDIISETKIES